MQVLNSKQYFKEILFSLLLIKPNNSPLKIEKLTSRTILKYHDEILLNFKKVFHMYQKRKSYFLIDILLTFYELLFIFKFAFLNKLSSIKSPVYLISRQIYLTESSNTDTFQYTVALNTRVGVIFFFPQYAIQTNITSNPTTIILNLIISKPVLIGCLEVCYFRINFEN